MTTTLKPRNGPGRATNDEIISFWVANTGRQNVVMPTGRSSLFTGGQDGDTIYTDGGFPLAIMMRGPRGKARSWFLVNGDTRGASVSYQQRKLRTEIVPAGLRFMIVPFSCLNLASIRTDTIRPAEITADRFERIRRREHRVPEWIRASLQYGDDRYHLRDLGDGWWEWEDERHVLGESLFSADYPVRWDHSNHRRVVRRALFLSGFDRQEPGLSYFLCELPQQAHPRTVAEAFTALKPQLVLDAEDAGLEVFRQGDIFAVPAGMNTRDLKSGGTYMRRAMGYVLGTTHVATDIIEIPAGTYARGILHHRPPGRNPDHARRPLGDQRTWYQLTKNTVPVDDQERNRAWSVPGNRARVD